MPADLVCAECGTDTATTYVVTFTGGRDPESRTEVCRSCDDLLRSPRAISPRPLSSAHVRIVYLLAKSLGATDTVLIRRWEINSSRTGDLAWELITPAGIRSRRAELVAYGIVEWSGAYGRTLANRRSRVWRLLSAPRASFAALAALPVPPLSPEAAQVLSALRLEAAGDIVVIQALDELEAIAGASA